VRWPDTIRNKELWRKTKQQIINLTIRLWRWKWIRHTQRKASNNITKQNGTPKEREREVDQRTHGAEVLSQSCRP
jgi:hypothetical protein